MTRQTPSRLDRPDPAFSRQQADDFIGVEDRLRGSLDQSRDKSQHRRFTALYEDLQN